MTNVHVKMMLALGIAGASAWAAAQPAGPPEERAPGRELRLADTNEDGQVTLEEAQAHNPAITEQAFSRFDRNGDGVLSPADRPDGPPPRVGRRGQGGQPDPARLQRLLSEADADGDDRVTLAEAQDVRPGFPPELFNRLDSNGDGAIDSEDRLPRGQRGPTPEQRFKHVDADGNGQITPEEFAAAAPPQAPEDAFARLDANADGVVTLDELPKRSRGDGAGGAEMGRVLRQADADNDGRTTYEELTTAKPGFPREMFDRMDRNGDGAVSREDRSGPPPQ